VAAWRVRGPQQWIAFTASTRRCDPVLRALLRGGMQAIGALGRVQNCLPLRIAPDSSEFSWMSSSDTTWPLTR
jgi:hypothetical protein